VGSGNFEALKPIVFEIEGVKVFAQKPTLNIKLTKDGESGSWSQKFAFVSDKDFEIPSLDIKYFDLKEKNLNTLIVSKTRVEVTQAYKKEELLDASEEPWKFNYEFIYYILTYMAGFLMAKVKFKRAKEEDGVDASFKAKVKASKSVEELMMILVLEDSKKYEDLIFKIESKELTSLKECKYNCFK